MELKIFKCSNSIELVNVLFSRFIYFKVEICIEFALKFALLIIGNLRFAIECALSITNSLQFTAEIYYKVGGTLPLSRGRILKPVTVNGFLTVLKRFAGLRVLKVLKVFEGFEGI